MKKFLLGIIIGVLALAAFLYYGGPGYLKLAGSKTEEAGTRLEKYEKQFKHTAGEAKEAVKETADTVKDKAGDAKETVDNTISRTRKAVDRTKERVKEYAP